MTRSAQVIRFWLDDLGPKGWYAGTPEVDAQVRERLLPIWQDAYEGGLGHWLTDAEGVLAYLVVTDQAPRNMFRDRAEAFLLDPLARAAAKFAIERDWDLRIDGLARQFFYLPLMHSENLVDQDRCVAAFGRRMPDAGNLLHARAHRAIIRQFGRFPYRNTALGRDTSPAEADFLAAGGYSATVRALSRIA